MGVVAGGGETGSGEQARMEEMRSRGRGGEEEGEVEGEEANEETKRRTNERTRRRRRRRTIVYDATGRSTIDDLRSDERDHRSKRLG